MKDYQFKLDFEVRDYECDLQGVVNHANYLHYLEHARHRFIRQHGIDFAALAVQHIYLVAIRIEVDYVSPLRSGDQFCVALNTERISRLRYGFLQDIYKLPDEKLVLRGKVVSTAINAAGKPFLPKDIEQILSALLPSIN